MPARQTVINTQPAPAVAGDFATTNPRASALFGPGAAVAGSSGLVIGLFCWQTEPPDADGTPAILNNFGAGPVTGFVAREQQGLNTIYLQDASMLIPTGFMATCFSHGDFWAKNVGAQAIPGMKAYANLANGLITFAATGTSTAGGTSTASTIAPATFSVTGSITNDTLTVTNVASGTVVNGATISGAGIATGTQIVSQSGGTPGGPGTYLLSIPEQTVAPVTVSGTYGLLTIGGTVAGAYGVGDPITGGTTAAGTLITQALTGVGGAGTYAVSPTQTVSSAALNASAVNVETKWFARSSGLQNELVKISDQPYG